MRHSGGCQCGQVRFEVEGKPINQMFCYCSECQSRTGGDKWFGIWYGYDQFRFTQGETETHTRPGSSGNDVHHHYCPECGTTVCADITVGKFFTIGAPMFDDSEQFTPKLAIFTSSAPKWAVLPTDIPVFERVPKNFG